MPEEEPTPTGPFRYTRDEMLALRELQVGDNFAFYFFSEISETRGRAVRE